MYTIEESNYGDTIKYIVPSTELDAQPLELIIEILKSKGYEWVFKFGEIEIFNGSMVTVTLEQADYLHDEYGEVWAMIDEDSYDEEDDEPLSFSFTTYGSVNDDEWEDEREYHTFVLELDEYVMEFPHTYELLKDIHTLQYGSK